MAVKVITDSTSYLPTAIREELDLGVAHVRCLLDGVEYPDDAEDCEAFFSALEASSAMPTTSQPTAGEIAALMEERVVAGHEVVGVFISAKLSGTIESARLARTMVLERHPGAVIEIVDSESNSTELGFAVLTAARAAAAGESVAETVATTRTTIERSRLLFVPSTLEYLRRGGRIGTAMALVGSILRIRPILTAADGTTTVFARVRTMERALATMVGTLSADIAAKGGLAQVSALHIHAPSAARALAERVAAVAGVEVPVVPVGPAIGAHVGPGAVGIAYCTNDPMLKSRTRA
ncbi:MAG: DegV family protein [Coriobacteriia bacterium]|nr:DegV family protein [Coriobacteriia bacterium]